MSRIRIVSAVVLGIALCAIPLSLQRPTGTAGFVVTMSSPAHAAELDIAQPARPRAVKRHHSPRVSRLYDLYCGGPYVGGGYNGGTYYGGPWIDLRCFDGSVTRPLRSSAIAY